MGLTRGHHRIENCSFEYCLQPLRFRLQDSNGAKVFFLVEKNLPLDIQQFLYGVVWSLDMRESWQF